MNAWEHLFCGVHHRDSCTTDCHAGPVGYWRRAQDKNYSCVRAVPTSDEFNGQTRFLIGSLHRAAAFFLQVSKLCTDLDQTLVYISVVGTYSKFALENKNASAWRLLPADTHERWPHVCRIKIMFTLLTTNSFVSTTKNWMKFLLNWTPLRICIRSRNTKPHRNHWTKRVVSTRLIT